MNRKFFIALILTATCACSSKEEDKVAPSRTAIFNHYLEKTFAPLALPFNEASETHVVLFTGYGCSYCNQATLKYLVQSSLPNLVVFTSDTPVQLKNLDKRVIYDTTAKNLPKVNLRTGEGPVYLSVKENKVTAYVFITSLNVDSLFTSIENAVLR
jgi:hypothetical protein